MTTPAELALLVLRRLSRDGCRFVCVNGHEDLPHAVRSDVDLVVAEEDVRSAHMVAVETATAEGFWLATALWYDLADCWALVFMSVDGDHLQLDFESDAIGVGRLGASRQACLDTARPDSRGIPVPGEVQRADYIARKREYKALTSPAELRSYGEALRLLGRAPRGPWPPDSRQLRMTHRRTRARELVLRQFSWTPWLSGNVRRLSWRLRYPTGQVVCLIGPDGAGKSATQAALAHLVRQSLQKHRLVHVRPRRLDRLVPGPRTPGTDGARPGPPDRDQGKSLGPAMLKLALMWLDVQTLRYDFFVARRRKTLLTWERGLFDLLLDPQRHGLEHVPQLLRQLALRTSPRADTVVACIGPASVLHARKPELPFATLEEQLTLTRELAARHGFRVVATDRPVDASELALLCLPTAAAARAFDRVAP